MDDGKLRQLDNSTCSYIMTIDRLKQRKVILNRGGFKRPKEGGLSRKEIELLDDIKKYEEMRRIDEYCIRCLILELAEEIKKENLE